MILACIADGGACILVAGVVAAGVSACLVKLGFKNPPCDPHCPENQPKIRDDGHHEDCMHKPD